MSNPSNITKTTLLPVVLGSGPDSLVVDISEDAWEGNAEFTLSVNGVQIGGTQVATASHAAGDTQAVTLLGSFGNGARTISVDFLNDAYGGSATMDRNLYVDSIANDGVVSAGAALFSAGTIDLAVGTPAPVTLGSGPDSLVVDISEDAWEGNAEFTLSVNGVQIGGTQVATASHAAGDTQAVTLLGSFGNGARTISVDFLNDAYGGSATMDRNLYVDSIANDGVVSAGAALFSAGTIDLAVGTPAPVTLGSGPDSLVVDISEDAWEGNAEFTLSVNGVQIGGTQVATASHAAGDTQAVTLLGSFGNGARTISVDFLNDAYGGSATMDRNLYVDSIANDGVVSAGAALFSAGTIDLAVGTPAPVTLGSGPDSLVVDISEDAWEGNAEFTLSVNGVQIGGTQVATASHAAGDTQAVTLLGSFGNGARTISVDFLNDAYGGSATMDRNLYVDSIANDGVVSAGGTLTNDGAREFVVSSGTFANDPLSTSAANVDVQLGALALTPANLTFDDEFNSFDSSPDGSTGWMTAYNQWGLRTFTGEAEYYSDSSVGVDPFSLNNGVLDITAAPTNPPSNPYKDPYTSGEINTSADFAQLYGYFEISARLPSGAGLWPAFWMWPENNSGASELDIFEVLEQDPTVVYTTAHEMLNGVASADGANTTVANTSTGFHTYAVDWEPTTLTFYVDGAVIAKMPTPSTMDTPMFMTVNLAVGTAGTWAGAPTSGSEFPATMQVNYVRAYATPATMDVSGSAAINLGGVLVQLPSAVGGEQFVVTLIGAEGAIVGKTTASDSGACSFSSVAVGALLASYVTTSGQTMIAPVDVTAGQMAIVSAGHFVAAATISGAVSSGPVGKAGVAVSLIDPSGTVAATTTTASDGTYVFAAVAAGTYHIKYAPPTGSLLQSGGPADTGTGLTGAVTVTAGQAVTAPTEPLIGAASIAGTLTLNGSADASAVVKLFNTTGTVLATATTTATGAFAFTGLYAGTYQVGYGADWPVVLQSGDPASISTGLSAPITLQAGQSTTLLPEGLLSDPASIQASAEYFGSPSAPAWQSGAGGVTVLLCNASGNVIATTTTDASSGWSSFGNLAAGTYCVIYAPPPGEQFLSGSLASSAAAITVAAGQSASTTGASIVSAPGSTASQVTLNTGDSDTATVSTQAISSTLGNHLFFLTGSSEILAATGGAEIALASGGGATITTGAYNDTIFLSSARNVVNAGGGTNAITDQGTNNTFVLAGLNGGTDKIAGALFSNGDIFDVRTALSGVGWDGHIADLGKYLSVQSANSGQDLQVLLANAAGSISTIATLPGQGNETFAAFQSHALLR